MAVSIQSVNGVGPAAAEALAQHGVVTPEQLAESSVEAISKVPGFSTGRAQRIITAAQALLNPADAPPTARVVADAAETATSVESDGGPAEQDPAVEVVELGDANSEQGEEVDLSEDGEKKAKKKKDKDKKKKKGGKKKSDKKRKKKDKGKKKKKK